MIKLCTDRCRECTRFALFFSSSLMHSMIYLFLSIILSHMGIKLILHLYFKTMNKLNTLTEQTIEEFLLNIPSVSKNLSIEYLCKHRPDSTIPVIYICSCKTEYYYFTWIITWVRFKKVLLKVGNLVSFCNFIVENQLLTKQLGNDYQRPSYRNILYGRRLLQVFWCNDNKIYAKTYWEKKISSKFYDVKGRSYADNDSFPRFWLSLL